MTLRRGGRGDYTTADGLFWVVRKHEPAGIEWWVYDAKGPLEVCCTLRECRTFIAETIERRQRDRLRRIAGGAA